MSLRIRIAILTVAIMLTATPAATACLWPLLEPFHWLFGCGYSPCGYGHGYGYGPGYGYGSGPNPYATYRFIDDWLGYGYLRNQHGTLGHYPGRPPGCYQPAWPGLLAAPGPIAPLPGPLPMMNPGPLPMSVPYGQDPCCDPCQDPCGSSGFGSPMMSCAPSPVPVTTWQPMTVDRGNWQMVWVPRPVTTMVPQTQYVMPSMPAMSAPAFQSFDSGCDSCGSDMVPSEGIPGAMMQQTMLPSTTSDSGCCGADSGMTASYPMMGMGGGYQTMGFSPVSQFPAAQPVAWSPQSSWNAGVPAGMQAYSAYPAGGFGGHRVSRRDIRRMMNAQHHAARRIPRWQAMSRYPSHQTAFGQPFGWAQPTISAWNPGYASAYASPMYSAEWMAPSSAGWQTASSQQWTPAATWQAAPVTSMPVASMPMGAMPVQTAWNVGPAPMMAGSQMIPATSMPVQMNAGMMMSGGDIYGDHEMMPATAAVPVIPNAFSGRIPVRSAVLSNSLQNGAVNRYPNVVR